MSEEKYVKTDSPACGFDCSDFHPGCPPPQVIDQGGRLWLFCPECRCLCNAEAVAVRITNDSGKDSHPKHKHEGGA